MKLSLFLLAGEASGDSLGSDLIESLQSLHQDLDLWGVGGPKMRNQGLDCLLPMEEFQLMGFGMIIQSLPKIYRQFKTIRNTIIQKNPDAVILIDYPGFNLRLARGLRKKGYTGKIIQYVSPTVWVWGKKRIDMIAKYMDILLCIFPFEPPIYKHTSLNVQYVGNPVVEALARYKAKKNILERTSNKPILAIFPGSRKIEIEKNLALELDIAKEFLKEHSHYQLVVSCSQPAYKKLIEKIIEESSIENQITVIPSEKSFALMDQCELAIAKSGTVTLELGLMEKPAIVVYKVDWLNRMIAKHILRLNIDYVCLVNILANKTVLPEFVTKPHTKEDLVKALSSLILDKNKRKICIEGCREVANILGTEKASENAAKAIIQSIC